MEHMPSLEAALNFIEANPDRVYWGEVSTVDLPLNNGKLGLVLSTVPSELRVSISVLVFIAV